MFTVNGIKVNTRIDGPAGAPWLTLVTGIANDLSMWDAQMPALGAFRVLRYDLRGQGGTQATPPPYSMELLVSDLVALWNELQIQKSHLAGLGLGGAVAQAAAIKHPDRLLSLAACCCRAKMVPDFAVLWHGLVETVKKNGFDSIVEPTAQRWFSDEFKAANPAALDRVRKMIRGTSQEGYLGCVGAFLGLDLEDRLPSIRTRALYISGAEDKMGGPPPLMAGLAAKVPGARHVSVPKAAHIANIQNAGGFNKVLGDFLEGEMRFLVLALSVFTSCVNAQSYPSKPVRWIVPTGPGSAVDVNARRVTPRLAEALGQPVIVENRPGANSIIGAREAARSAPDGYTLYQAVVNNAINDALAPDACCVLNDKLVAVTRLYTTPLVMVVHPGVQAATLQEYVALARSKPNTLTYASGGSGAITQMVGELLKLTAGIQVREIPYKAIGAELPDLTGGHVSTAFLSPVVIREHVRAGKLRALGIADRQRLPNMPEVPTLAEAGVPIEGLGWNGIFVPAGTPQAVIDRLQTEIAKVLRSKDVQDDAATLGTIAGGERPQEFAAFVRGEVQKWGKVIKDAGIKAE